MTGNLKTRWILCGMMLFAIGWAMPAIAQQSASDSDPWSFSIAPYLWMSGIDGDITVKGQRASMDAGFDDVWSDFEFGGNLNIEIGKGRWGAFIDPTYSEITMEETTAAGTTNTEASIRILEFGGFYRVVGPPTGMGSEPAFRMDILGGGRYWDVTGKIRNTYIGKFEQTADWLDPFIGLRILAPMTRKAAFSARGDIGGLGAGSDFTFNFAAAFGYDFTEIFSAWLGYRILSVDYEDGEGSNRIQFDTTWHGPMVGFMLRF
ncbi:MAG: hypothetical protein COS92_06445 [Desulfobacterales bacterium CG07_land_8_20_14_0_80_52_14]|nr:MAG: hypothetical protein COS92_06445 [Desulfobacterales bacterium CG07_land_8_20_14_0_80_52_14]